MKLRDAIFKLNCNYGRGDIVSIDVRNRTVKTAARAGGEWKFRYRIKSSATGARILHYRGHQQQIGAGR